MPLLIALWDTIGCFTLLLGPSLPLHVSHPQVSKLLNHNVLLLCFNDFRRSWRGVPKFLARRRLNRPARPHVFLLYHLRGFHDRCVPDRRALLIFCQCYNRDHNLAIEACNQCANTGCDDCSNGCSVLYRNRDDIHRLRREELLQGYRFTLGRLEAEKSASSESEQAEIARRLQAEHDAASAVYVSQHNRVPSCGCSLMAW